MYYTPSEQGNCCRKTEKRVMPPDLDIYGLTKHRDTTTIDRFLDTYVDRAKSWDRGDEELMMEPLPLTHPETAEDIPAA